MSELYHRQYARRDLARRQCSRRRLNMPSTRWQLLLRGQVDLWKVYWLAHIAGLLVVYLCSSAIMYRIVHSSVVSNWLETGIILLYALFSGILVWRSSRNTDNEFWGWMAKGASFILIYLIAYNGVMAWYESYNMQFGF